MISKKEIVEKGQNAKVEESETKKKNFRIFLLKRFWFVLLASLAGFFLFSFFFLSFFNPSKEGVLEYSLGETIKEVVFNIPSAKVDFNMWEKDSIKINYELSEPIPLSDYLEVVEDKEGGIWNFFWKDDYSFFNKNNSLPHFEIYIPYNLDQSLSFYVIYGDINLNSIEEKKVVGSLLSGNINLKDIINSYGDIQVGWGSINTQGRVENKEWYTYTGFSGFIPSKEGKNLNLSVFMGSLK